MPETDHPRNLIGAAVQRLRTERGWSQSELAAKCQISGWDISRSIVAAIEGSVRWVGDWEALCISRVFKVPVAALYPENADLTEFLAHADKGVPTIRGRRKKAR